MKGQQHTLHVGPLMALNGTLLKEQAEIPARWVEHFSAQLKKVNPTDPSATDELPHLPAETEMDTIITDDEVTEAISSLEVGNAAGPDGLPPDPSIYGDSAIVKLLTEFCQSCWMERDVHTQWLRTNIVIINKKKKNMKSECINYRDL